MARFVKSKFFPSAPCNLLILLNKKRVCSCNSSLITKGLRHYVSFSSDVFGCNSSLITKGLRLYSDLKTSLHQRCNSSLITKGLRHSTCLFGFSSRL